MKLQEREETNTLNRVDNQGVCDHCGWRLGASNLNVGHSKVDNKTGSDKSTAKYWVIL